MAAHRESAYLAVSRALLTGGAVMALARVYSGASWAVPMLVAAALPVAALSLGERRRWNPLVSIAGAVFVAAWLAVVVDDPSETVAGIPSASALAAFGHDLSRAPHVLRSAVVPVDPVGAALVLAVIAVFVAALATELIVRRLDAPVGAIGPSVALFVAICALGSGRWAPTTAVYALVIVGYLVALQHAELAARRTWFQSTAHRRSQLVAGGVGAGALVVALAVAFGPNVPWARGSALLNYRSLGNGSGSSILNVTSPLVSVGAKLNGENSTREVFSVKTTEAKGDYWRVIALDQFQDDGWGLNSDQRRASKLPGPTHGPGATTVTQTFHLAAIDARWLPAAYRPTHISLSGAYVLPDSSSLILDKPLNGVTYDVESEVATPDQAVLESVTEADLAPKTASTALPGNFSSRARDLALNVTREATTPYDKALALMDFFHQPPFTYDQSVDLGTTANALDRFLFETQRGFCEQYAAAFAELARAIGLPARVAVGYQRGTLRNDGLWHVEERDAHAWPEVWLGANVGWYRFEPTPGRIDPVTHLGGPVAGGGPTTTTPTTTPKSTTPTTASLTPSTTPRTRINVTPPPTPTHKSHTRARAFTAILVGLAILLGAALVAIAALGVGAWRRTRRRRKDPDDRRRVLGAWTEAMERLTAAGIERRPSTTSLEFALRQAPALGAGEAGPPLMTLARLHTAAMYSPDAPSEDEADDAWAEFDAIAAALRTTVPRSRRWRARLAAVLHRPKRGPDLTAPDEVPRSDAPVGPVSLLP